MNSLSIELTVLLLALPGIGLSLFLLEKAYRKYNWNNTATRKFVHVLIGFMVCLAALLSPGPMPVIVVAAVFLIINFFAVRKNRIKSIHIDTVSYGTVYYPLAVIILSFWIYRSDKPLFIICVLLLSVADTVAAIIGRRFARSHFTLVGEKKSLIGAGAMFITAAVIISLGLIAGYQLPVHNAMISALAIAIPVSAIELLSDRGSDNLFVPLLSAFLLKGLLAGLEEQILLGILFASIVAMISYRFAFLDASGAISALILGTMIFGFGGYKAAITIMIFFVFSSILSRISKKKKSHIHLQFEKSGQRDYKQVLANGGIPLLILIINFLNPVENYIFLYLTAIAASNADTWATEIGIFSRKDPRLITTFERVPRGVSGAQSLLGSTAAMAGSGVIAISGMLYYYSYNDHQFFMTGLLICLLAGYLGSVIDSYLGATIQVQYFCRNCAAITEKKNHCNQLAEYKKGFIHFNNDAVNFVSAGLSTVIVWILI